MLFNPLCPLQLEFGKMQKLVFRYLYEECFSNLQFRQPVSYFAAEKISKIWISHIPRFNPLKSTLCAHRNSDFENAEIGL